MTWWGWTVFAVALYIGLLLACGVRTVTNRHVLLFIAGFFLPLLWVVGALWPRPREVIAVREVRDIPGDDRL